MLRVKSRSNLQEKLNGEHAKIKKKIKALLKLLFHIYPSFFGRQEKIYRVALHDNVDLIEDSRTFSVVTIVVVHVI